MTEIRHATERDSGFVREVLDGWNGPYIAVHGDLIDASALRFYQRRRFDLAAVHHHDAVAAARALKPSIPEESDGIPIRHELELRLDLRLDRRDLAEPA